MNNTVCCNAVSATNPVSVSATRQRPSKILRKGVHIPSDIGIKENDHVTVLPRPIGGVAVSLWLQLVVGYPFRSMWVYSVVGMIQYQ